MTIGQYIPFGVRTDGRLVDPSSVERGLACNCTCPSCRLPLVAKQGEIRVHHFSHLGDHSCKNGQTAALLMAAKQILQEARRISVPALRVTGIDQPRFALQREKSWLIPATCWQLESVVIDHFIHGVQVGTYGHRTDGAVGIVEFRITAKTSTELRTACQSTDLAAVEVNLLPLVGRSITMADLTTEICDRTDHREWLHHPEATRIENELVAQLVAERPAVVSPAVQRPQWLGRPGLIPRTGSDLSKLDPERLAIRKEHDRYRALTLEQKFAELAAALGAPVQTWPHLFATVPPHSRPTIAAPASLWQGALFQQFVLGVRSKPHERDPGFFAAAPNGWVGARFGLNAGTAMPTLITEVERFLKHLVASGYLQLSGDRYFVVRDTLPSSGGSSGSNDLEQ